MFQTQILQSFALPHVAHKSSCYPEGNFEGNQLLMVRLVFRPYTHVRRTICHVSIASDFHQGFPFDFILHKHSSPSFGSQHTCSSEDLHPKNQSLLMRNS
eukprot:UN03161